jgi:hypothetical protein
MILRRIDGSRFSEVLPLWSGLTAVILGGGPSLTQDQVALVRRAREAGTVRVIAVNDAYLLAPWADVQYAADAHWHRWHTEGIAKPVLGLTAQDVRARWAGFAGQKCSIQNSGEPIADDAVHMLRNRDFPRHGVGLSLDPRALVTGRNSGFQALNLAVLTGAKRVILLGFDGKPNEQGKEHFHGGHPKPTPAAAYPLYRQAMSSAENAIEEAGVTVLNCSPGSEINSFPKVALEGAL